MSIGADLIVAHLEALGSTRAFGIPGGPLSGIFHALSQSHKIHVHLTQHETASAYIAMGSFLFGEDTNSVPIVFATAGPGMLNLLTGVASAFEESVPLFVLTANVSLDQKGTGAVQDSYESGLNVVSMFSSITAKSAILTDMAHASAVISDLYKTSLLQKRPVHLNIPADIAHRRVDVPKANRTEMPLASHGAGEVNA